MFNKYNETNQLYVYITLHKTFENIRHQFVLQLPSLPELLHVSLVLQQSPRKIL